MTSSLRPGATPLRVGSRGSALAMVQATWVADRLGDAGVPTEITIIRTAGDDRAPDTAWGEGAFVTAIEAALVAGRIDIAVHSAKDVPTKQDPRLVIAAWTDREDPRDALVCRVRGSTLATLPHGARVGTDSPRRRAFLRAVRPDLVIHQLSGNVDTRLRKLDDGDSDALVLAVAGLVRLGHDDRIDEILPLEVAVPAPGQGCLALQVRADDALARAALAPIDHAPSRIAVEAERAFLAATGGGCRSPIGALGTVDGRRLTLQVAAERGFTLPDGRTVAGGVVRASAAGPTDGWAALAGELATRVVRLRSRARILLTGPAGGALASAASTALDAAGFVPVAVPAIEIHDDLGGDALERSVAASRVSGTWLVATSPNGVRIALDAMRRAGIAPATFRWAVVGRASARPLVAHGVHPFVPDEPLGSALAAEIPVVTGEPVLVVRGDLADPRLVEVLAARGAVPTEIVAYRTDVGPGTSRRPLADALAEPIDAIVLASGSAVRGLLALAEADRHALLLGTPAVCIGPTTVAAARSLGFRAIHEAVAPTPEALVMAVTAALTAHLPDIGPASAERPVTPTRDPVQHSPGGPR